MPLRSQSIGPRLLLFVAVLIPLLWLFGSVLFGGRSLVFRDAAHYYYPLMNWTTGQWSTGEIPLWNSQENCGTPIIGEATSSLFYPGKLLFALPLEFSLLYKLYIILHWLGAAWAAYALARHWQAGPLAAGICAISYALGGNILIQYSNVVFLVGAAWLPLALLAADKMLVQRRFVWALLLGAILALMTLGGDPQAAYHAGLLAALYAWLLWRRDRKQREPPVTTDSGGWMQRLFTHRLALLTMAAITGLLLAAVQIVPSMQWTRQSDRAARSTSRNVYELAGDLLQSNPDNNSKKSHNGIFAAAEKGSHRQHVYHFSVGPWRLPELVWPNFSGRTFPTYRRWTAVIPAQGRVWTPSLYMGLLPLLLALGSWSLRRRQHGDHRRWISWAVLFSAMASLGWFGLGWVINELRVSLAGTDPNDITLGNPVGGVYWLMVVFLPGYVYFRYPAKLMIVAALGMSLLAAHGWDRMIQSKAILIRRVLVWLGSFSALAALGTLLIRPFWQEWMQHVEPDSYFGPLDATGAANDLLAATAHAALLCGLLWYLLGRLNKKQSVRWQALLLLLTCIELTWAHGWMIASIPDQQMQQASLAVQQISKDQQQQKHDTSVQRIYRATPYHWYPSQWKEVASPLRQMEGFQWDRDTLAPRYHLLSDAKVVESTGTMLSYDYLMLLRTARRFGPRRSDQVAEPHPAVLTALATQYFILPEDFQFPHTQRIDDGPVLPNSTPAKEKTIWRHDQPLSRAWIVHQVERLPLLTLNNPASVSQRTELVFFPGGRPRDMKHSAVVETDANFPLNLLAKSSELIEENTDETCQIVVDQPSKVEIVATLQSPGLVVLSDLYYPGWQAGVQSDGETVPRREKIWRTNRVMRGIMLPAGKHRIVYRYRPIYFYMGLIVSIFAWLLLAIVGAAMLLATKRNVEKNRAG